MSKLVNESLNEFKTSKTSPINYKKLVEYAKAIETCCGGEYGITFYNEKENHVFICLGDSNPFDGEMLKSFIKEYIKKDYKSMEEIIITIEDECTPRGEDWKKIK